MSNYRTMSEVNEGLNNSRRSIKSSMEYLKAVLANCRQESTAYYMATKGINVLSVADKYSAQAYLSTGCQYNDARMNYLEAMDLVQDCQSEINGTSVQEEIEKEIAYEVAIRITEREMESILEYFDDITNLDEVSMPDEMYHGNQLNTLRQYQHDCLYAHHMECDGYDPSDYD